jgi:fluoride exporter
MQNILGIAIGGSVGTLARYGLTAVIKKYSSSPFPIGTITVNIIGSFLFGIIFAFLQSRQDFPPQLKAAATIGFLGAFTTFSTYMVESGILLKESQWLMFAGNILIQNMLGLGFVFLGFYIGKHL